MVKTVTFTYNDIALTVMEVFYMQKAHLFYTSGHKIHSLLLALCLVVTLMACGKKPQVIVDDDDYTPTRVVTETKLITYDGPSIFQTSELASIQINGTELFVYETLVNHGRTFTFEAPNTKAAVAYFDFEGEVLVEITVPEIVTSAIVRPLEYGIQTTFNGNKISFKLNYSSNYVIEYNGLTEKAIHLFANPIEENPIDPNNIPEDMIYLGPGVYKADAIPLESGQTLYIAGGAVVYGQVRLEGVENVTIRGRGIIDGSVYPRTKASEYTVPLEFRNSSDIHIEGITVLNPAGWVLLTYFSEDILVDNIKIITARGNGDGISIQSSKNVLVKNSFVRSWDDALVVKNVNGGATDNIVFDSVSIWTDLAQSMEVGYETHGSTMTNITFKNITVLHNFHKPVMSIHNADDSDISNVTFQNITIEDARMIGDNALETYDNFLIELSIRYNQEWSTSGGARGTIKDVLFDNIKVLDGNRDLVASLYGYDAEHKVENITFNNVSLYDKVATKDSDLNLTRNNFVSNVKYTNEGTLTGRRLRLPYKLQLSNSNVNVTEKPNITQVGYIIPDFAIVELPNIYMGQEVLGTFTAAATKGISSTIYDDGSGVYTQVTHDAANVLDKNFNTFFKSLPFPSDNGTYVTLDIKFDENKKIGNIRIYGDLASNAYFIQNIAVYAVRSTSTTNAYAKLLNSNNYEFSKAKGNYVDIKLAPGEYKAIQLRFYKVDGPAGVDHAFASEVLFFPASLTYNKSVTATTHADVYTAQNMTDGNPLTYYEASNMTWPAVITIDLAGEYLVKYFTLNLPPLAQWSSRSQEIAILVSTNGVDYQIIKAKETYVFDPSTGNLVEIVLETPVEAKYVRFEIYSNNALGNYGAQLSEISIFE